MPLFSHHQYDALERLYSASGSGGSYDGFGILERLKQGTRAHVIAPPRP